MKAIKLAMMLWLATAGCGSKTNPDVCCTDAANCAAQGLPDTAQCTDGLICRGNQCVAETCSSGSDCEAGAPYCTSTGLCAMSCDSDIECPGFGGDGKNMFCAMGACVQCRTSSDCSGDTPLCDTAAGTCHGCSVDADCASGACGTTGACVAEADLIYVDGMAGNDVGQCTKNAPCKTVQFAVNTAVLARSQIVLTPVTYKQSLAVNTTTTSASTVTIHGHGATLQANDGSDGPALNVGNVGLIVTDTNFIGNSTASGPVQSGIAPVELRHVKVTNDGTLVVGSNMTLFDVEFADGFTGPAIGVESGSHLSADRLNFHGGFEALRSSGTATISITNMLVTGMSGSGIDISQATGSISASTIADSNLAGITGCSSSMKLDSDIVWTPAYGTPVEGTCVVAATIAGPQGSVGSHSDPLFVDETHRDYHLRPTSPAIDVIGSGPATDLDGTVRPQGARFDAGAFEYKP